jgi:type I restriction enzyme S subunit
MQIAKKSHFVIRSGDVIYNKLFAWKGTFGLVPPQLDGMFVSDKFPTYLLDSTQVNENWLRWYFHHPAVWEQARSMSTGSAALSKLTLNPPKFLLLTMPVPPLDEQRRIVARIEELAAQIHEARELRKLALEQAEALSVSLLLALLPRDIEMRRLGDLVATGKTISYGVLVPGPHLEDGVPFVRIQDLDLRNPPALPNKRIARDIEAQYKRTRLRGGEILIGVVGSIGKLGVAPASWAGANIARAVCRIVPSDAIDRDYLVLVLSSRTSQDYFRQTTRTLAQPTLNVAQLSHLPIPLPPLYEQRRIVAELGGLQAQVDAMKHLQSDTAAELDALLPSVLSKAFAGEL